MYKKENPIKKQEPWGGGGVEADGSGALSSLRKARGGWGLMYCCLGEETFGAKEERRWLVGQAKEGKERRREEGGGKGDGRREGKKLGYEEGGRR